MTFRKSWLTIKFERGKPAGLFNDLFCVGCEELVAQDLEVGVEETLTETVLEGLVEIL